MGHVRTPLSNYNHLSQSFPDPRHPPHYTMNASEPLADGDTPPDVESRSATTAVLNADIGTLTAFKDIVHATPVKTVFESVIVILTLVRVRFLTLFQSSCPLIGNAIRMK